MTTRQILALAMIAAPLPAAAVTLDVIEFEGRAPASEFQFQQDGYTIAAVNAPTILQGRVGRIGAEFGAVYTISRDDGEPFGLRRIDIAGVESFVQGFTSITGTRPDGTAFFVEDSYRMTWDALTIEAVTRQGAPLRQAVNPWLPGPAWGVAEPNPVPVGKESLLAGSGGGFPDIYRDLSSLSLSFRFRDSPRSDEFCHPSNYVRVDPRLELERQCTGQDLTLYDDDAVFVELFDVWPSGAPGPWVDLRSVTLAAPDDGGSAQPAPIPLPATGALLAFGLAILGARRGSAGRRMRP